MLSQKRKLAALLLLAIVLLSGCHAGRSAPESYEETENMISADAVWIAYWGQENAAQQLEALDVKKLCLFGAHFDKNGGLVVPENTRQLAAQLKELNKYTLYLTVVNDIVSQEEENSLKDTELLASLIGTEAAAKQHVSELLDTVQAYGLDGVEIDYERIRKDYDLWEDFIRFIELLLPEAEARGLAVRVLLEPSTPVEDLTLPAGPEYVVMCYNLYGSGTKPGPKADREFLLSLKQRFGALPNIGYALANGGYRWDKGGNASSLTTSAAAALARENGAAPSRDEDNGALSFTYRKDGKKYTVWYSDASTLELWAGILNENEPNSVPISIWRLNG